MIDCLFCRIVAGEIPADVVLRTDEVVAFRDISPQAPMHVLVIPVEHHTNVAELSANAPHLTAKVLDAAAAVAAQEGLGDQGHRPVLRYFDPKFRGLHSYQEA